MLGPADQLAEEFKGQLRTYTIAFPKTLYEVIWKQMKLRVEVDEDGDEPKELFHPRWWRALPGSSELTEGSIQEGLGYWVRQGRPDMAIQDQTLHREL